MIKQYEGKVTAVSNDGLVTIKHSESTLCRQESGCEVGDRVLIGFDSSGQVCYLLNLSKPKRLAEKFNRKREVLR